MNLFALERTETASHKAEKPNSLDYYHAITFVWLLNELKEHKATKEVYRP